MKLTIKQKKAVENLAVCYGAFTRALWESDQDGIKAWAGMLDRAQKETGVVVCETLKPHLEN